MIDLLETSKIAIDVRLDTRGAPNEYHCVTLQEITVRRIRDIVELLCRHAIILSRLLETMLF